MRLGKLIIVIGLVLLIVSFNPSGTTGRSIQAMNDSYTAQFVMVTRDFNLNIESYEGGTFSFHILTESDSYRLLENSSIDTLNPLLTRENISEFNGIITIPSPGWYAICIRSTNSSVVQVDFLISGIMPIMSFFSAGIMFMLVGTLVLLLSRHWRKLLRPHQEGGALENSSSQ